MHHKSHLLLVHFYSIGRIPSPTCLEKEETFKENPKKKENGTPYINVSIYLRKVKFKSFIFLYCTLNL